MALQKLPFRVPVLRGVHNLARFSRARATVWRKIPNAQSQNRQDRMPDIGTNAPFFRKQLQKKLRPDTATAVVRPSLLPNTCPRDQAARRRRALALRAGFAARFFIVFAIAFSLSLSQLSFAQDARITTTCDGSKCETNIKPVLIA